MSMSNVLVTVPYFKAKLLTASIKLGVYKSYILKVGACLEAAIVGDDTVRTLESSAKVVPGSTVKHAQLANASKASNSMAMVALIIWNILNYYKCSKNNQIFILLIFYHFYSIAAL